MAFLADHDALAFSVIVFVAVLLLFESLVLAWRSHRGARPRKLRQRLHELAGPSAAGRSRAAALLKPRALEEPSALDRWLAGIPPARHLERLLQQADVGWSAARLLVTSALAGTVVVAAGLARGGVPLAIQLALALAAASLPWAWVGWKRDRRMQQIGRQLPDALDLIARAMKAGHAFGAGLKMAAEELPEPIASEFLAVHEEVSFGIAMPEALRHLSERVPSTDVRYFTVSVLIQRESGGNLAELLTQLSRLVRERAKLMGRIRVLSADGRLSAWILVLLPLLLGLALHAANPRFMGPLFTDPIGVAILKYLAFSMVLGLLVLRRIVRIRV